MKKDYDRIRVKVAKDPDLGKVEDSVLAEKYGVSKFFVCKIRNRLNIPFKWKRNVYHPPATNKEKVLEYKQLLGKYSDTSIADFLGFHKETVRRVRAELGLPAAKKKLDYFPLSKEQQLMHNWPCIPERVGLTKNEWRKKCALI